MSGVVRGEEQAKPTAAPASPTPTPPVTLHKSGVVVPGNGPSPNEPPQPALQKHGFNGGIQQFNQRAQSVVDSYTQAYGMRPSPGLVFDLAKSPVDTADFSRMFTVPQNPLAAKNRGIVNQFHTPAYTTRQDGYRVPARPQVAPPPVNQAAMLKKYPWVDAQSMIPVSPKLLGEFWNSLGFLAKNAPIAKQLTESGMTLQQYSRENQLAQGLVNPQPGNAKDFGTMSLLTTAEKQQRAVYGITTIKQVQQTLASKAPEFFSHLPQTGTMDQDWAKAISQYQSSTLFYKQQTQQLAHDNHFGSDTAGFEKAWQAKQNALKKYPQFHAFLAAQPLAVFSHGPDAFRNYLTGDTKGLGWIDVPTWGLNLLAHTAGLVSTEIGSALDQVKAEAAAGRAYLDKLNAITPQDTFALHTDKKTEAEARAAAAKALEAKPSWAGAFSLPTTGKYAAIGEAANLGLDLLIGAPYLSGETVAAGDVAKLASSRYFNGTTRWAYNTLAQKGSDGIAEAAASLEGGRGAIKLSATYAQKIHDGEMSLPEFQQRAAELYAHGKTVDGLVGGDLNTPILKSLRGKGLPTPGPVAQSWRAMHSAVKDALDEWENTLRARKVDVGRTSNAADMVSSVRQTVARAAPRGSQHLFDEKLPQDIYNWSRKYLKDQKVAYQLRNDYAKAVAADDVQAMAAVNDRMLELYRQAHPGKTIPDNPFAGSQGPLVEAESRSYFYFPSTLDTNAKTINERLNSLGAKHRQVIVGGDLNPVIFPYVPGGGESLAYKHISADTGRRIVGGGGLFGLTPDLRRVRTDVQEAMKDDPELIRVLGVNKSQAQMGEQRWITGQRLARTDNFNTADHLDNGKQMTAAGAFLRNHLASDALKAYQSSSKDNLKPLVDLVLRDRFYRSQLDKVYANDAVVKQWGLDAKDLKIPVEDKAQAYAEALFNSYKEIEEAGTKAGMNDPLGAALNVLVKNVGPKADKKLGQWIAENKLGFNVTDPLVEATGKRFDTWMQKWIGVLMTANKWNRGQLFDYVFYSTVRDLRNAGWETKPAVAVAADLAKAQTVYHMLDFSNMLQIEQDLRWASYFATKHRLYWTWILRQLGRRPGAAALIHDVSKSLDSKGNLELTVFGKRFYVPVMRLFWVNNRDYPQTSPPLQAAAETVKGLAEGKGLVQATSDAFGSLTSTSGNLFTRNDQAWMFASKLAGVSVGKIPPTADAVTFGWSPQQQKFFFEQVNQYSVFYHAEHGTWPTEADAVKHTLLAQTKQEFWRANLPLPVTWDEHGTPTAAVKKEQEAYARILDPAEKRAYLDNHPDLAIRFGIAKDPAVFLHNAPFWAKFNSIIEWRNQQLQKITDTMYRTGVFGGDLRAAMKKVSAEYQAKIDQLKLADAASWHGSADFPKGREPGQYGYVSDGTVVRPGPWGVALEGDELATRPFVHQWFPGVPKSELDAHTVGAQIVNLQNDLTRYNKALRDKNPAEVAEPDLQHVQDHISNLSQRLAPFFGQSTSIPGKAWEEYSQKFYGPYIAQREDRFNQINALPSTEKAAAWAAYAAWRDSHDHPVVLDVNGHKVTFKSPVKMGYLMQPPTVEEQRLAKIYGQSGWMGMADYEKELMGMPTSPGVSDGYATLLKLKQEYKQDPATATFNLSKQQVIRAVKAIDKGVPSLNIKPHPGFFKAYVYGQQNSRYEIWRASGLFKAMPQEAQQQFDELMGPITKAASRAIVSGTYPRSYVSKWHIYVRDDILPQLQSDQYTALRQALAPYGPNFLDNLVLPGNG